MIKAAFFDIDGTLVTSKAKALDSTRRAIAELKKQGIICGIATGRGPFRLAEQIDQLTFDVYVTYNGQYVYTDKEVLYANAFPRETVEQLIVFCETNNRHILFGAADEMAGSSVMMFGQKASAKRLQKFLPKGPLKRLIMKIAKTFPQKSKNKRYRQLAVLKKPIYQCVMISPLKEQGALEKLFPECKFTRSNPYTVDIILKDSSKSVGIEKAGSLFDFTLKETVAFGDSWNDEEMLRDVGIGVAMGNAMAEIKELADYITKSNTEDGIDYALRQLKLLKKESD